MRGAGWKKLLGCPLWVVSAFVATGCASAIHPEQVDAFLSQSIVAAERYHKSNLDTEAALLIDAVANIDPDYPGLRELDGRLAPEARSGMDRGFLGMNRKLRPRVERPTAQRVLLWLPDRLLDLMDVATFGVHLGPGAFGDWHFTRALQASGGFRATGGVGLHEHRSLGLKSQSEAGLNVLAMGAQAYGGALIGTSGVWSGSDSMAGMHRPDMRLYSDLRDYWAIGTSATAAIIGFEVDLHPLQLADFFAGLFLVDFLNDDFAHTRGLKIGGIDEQLLVQLARIQRSPETLSEYLARRDLDPNEAPDDTVLGQKAPDSVPERPAAPSQGIEVPAKPEQARE